MASVWGELKRRNVVKVAAAYAIVGWLLVQIADVFFPALQLPDWTVTLVVGLVILGFPLALILSWAYDLTPEGIALAKPASAAEGTLRTSRGKLNYAIIGLLVVAIAFLVLNGHVFRNSDSLAELVDVSDSVPGFSGRAAIAVLPFVNLSDDRSQEYFSDGITEDIIQGLQSMTIFPVISRTSTFFYKGGETGISEIASDLGAGYILEGSVRKVDDQVRITARLNDATGKEVWSDTYNESLSDVFTVQDQIRDQIIGAIEPELLLNEINLSARVRPEDMQAWDFFLQASADTRTFSGYADRNGQPIDLERTNRARDLALEAIQLDELFADAHTLLGHIYATYTTLLRTQVTDEFAEEALQKALDYTSRGRELNPFSASTCSCYASLLATTGELQRALDIQEPAVAANPANAQARATLANLYRLSRRYGDAQREIDIAKRLSPKDFNMSVFLSIEAGILTGEGEWELAARVASQAIELTSLNARAHAIRIVALYALGRPDAAVAAIEELHTRVPNFSVQVFEGDLLSDALGEIVSPLLDSNEEATFGMAVGAIIRELGQGT